MKKRGCGSEPQYVNTASPETQTRRHGTPNGPHWKQQGNEAETKTETRMAGRADKETAHLSYFCLTLFEIASI